VGFGTNSLRILRRPRNPPSRLQAYGDDVTVVVTCWIAGYSATYTVRICLPAGPVSLECQHIGKRAAWHCAAGSADTMPVATENRLARETSPYLLQHAHNPVG
jgi:hypothetical protein